MNTLGFPAVDADGHVEEIGVASDYAHFDWMCPDSVKTVSDREDLAPDLKPKLLRANAARLFNLKLG